MDFIDIVMSQRHSHTPRMAALLHKTPTEFMQKHSLQWADQSERTGLVGGGGFLKRQARSGFIEVLQVINSMKG